MSTLHPQPRRRVAAPNDRGPCNFLPQLNPKGCSLQSLFLRKGATFQTSKSPSSSIDDPVLDIRKVPLRSPTCPQKLEELVAAGENRIATLLDGIDKRFGRGAAGQASGPSSPVDIVDTLPVPAFLLANAASTYDPMEIDSEDTNESEQSKSSKTKPAAADNRHEHLSDSGLGSSIDTNPEDRCSIPDVPRLGELCSSTSLTALLLLADLSGVKPIARHHSVYTAAPSGASPREQGLYLQSHALDHIKKHIVDPLLAQENLKDYHKLVGDLPSRIEERKITCLRDLEKTLIFLAPVSTDVSGDTYVLAKCFLDAKSKASSPASYFRFCQSSIQCIYTTYNYLNEREQRRATDRPYTPNYFVDLIQQVRQYASIMEQTRRRQAQGKAAADDDYTPLVYKLSPLDPTPDDLLVLRSGERLRLQGGLGENGRPAELVREKDGKIIPLQSAEKMLSPAEDDFDVDDPDRSMARKRKCDIGKEVWRACRECGKSFKRSCDLTKHEKTHTRPWKCPQESCKYHTLGWPTEKECDRHVNDKHSSAPALYKCLYEDCAYTSKRESNCKQHMEKTHGYSYVRSKSKKASRLVPTAQTPSSSTVPTPASASPSLSSPTSNFDSLMESGSNGSAPAISVNTAGSDFDVSVAESESMFGSPQFDFGTGNDNTFVFDAFNGGFPSAPQGFSPVGSDGHHGSMAAGGEEYSPSSELESMLSGNFESPFDFGPSNVNNPWPSPQEFFTSFHNNGPAQQPTPACSDFNFDKQVTAGATEDVDMADFLSMPPPQTSVYGAPQDLSLYSPPADVYPQDQPSASGLQGEDFELFGEDGESSNMAQMFPALGNVGDQFPSTAAPSYDTTSTELDAFNFGQ